MLPSGGGAVTPTSVRCSMTSGAQQALRRTIEIYSNTTRFALACNQSSKIIEPIQSRCAIVRYSRLSDQEVLERLMVVAREEKARRTGPVWGSMTRAAEASSRHHHGPHAKLHVT